MKPRLGPLGPPGPRSSRPGLLAVLVLAALGGAPAAAQTSGSGSFECGITVIQGGEPTLPNIVEDGDEELVALTRFPLPCGGAVAVTFVLEVSTDPLGLGAKAHVRARAGCTGSAEGLPGVGLACIEGTVVALEPQKVILPVPIGFGLVVVGPDTRAVTFGGVLPRGRYVLAVDLEAIGGAVEVGKRFLHVLGTGAFPALADRAELLGGFGLSVDIE